MNILNRRKELVLFAKIKMFLLGFINTYFAILQNPFKIHEEYFFLDIYSFNNYSNVENYERFWLGGIKNYDATPGRIIS